MHAAEVDCANRLKLDLRRDRVRLQEGLKLGLRKLRAWIELAPRRKVVMTDDRFHAGICAEERLHYFARRTQLRLRISWPWKPGCRLTRLRDRIVEVPRSCRWSRSCIRQLYVDRPGIEPR